MDTLDCFVTKYLMPLHGPGLNCASSKKSKTRHSNSVLVLPSAGKHPSQHQLRCPILVVRDSMSFTLVDQALSIAMSSHQYTYADLHRTPETYQYHHMGRAETEEDMAAFYMSGHPPLFSYTGLDLDPPIPVPVPIPAPHTYDNALLSSANGPYLAYADQWPPPPAPASAPPRGSPYRQPTTTITTTSSSSSPSSSSAYPSHASSLYPDPAHPGSLSPSAHSHTPTPDPNQSKDNNLAHYGHPNADGSWRCAHPGCTSTAVFRRGCDLRKHFNRHRKHLFCRHEGCPQAVVGGFSSKKDRARHEAKHNPGVECEWPDCGRVFSRVDNMKDHVRRIHQRGAGVGGFG